jgi:hypothetical protein
MLTAPGREPKETTMSEMSESLERARVHLRFVEANYDISTPATGKDLLRLVAVARAFEDEIDALRARLAAAERRTEALVRAIEEMREIIRRRPGDAILRVDDRARAALAGSVDAPTGGDDAEL